LFTQLKGGEVVTLFDPKFRRQPWRYLAQSGLAFLVILAVLSFLNLFNQTTMVASLGASTFIVFAMPSTWSAQPRGLVGGYLVGMAVGAAVSGSYGWLLRANRLLAGPRLLALFGAIAVGLTILIMVITNTEHPPAVGIALALVINPWDIYTLLFLLLAATILGLVRSLFSHWLIDLH
jgi:CBS-domain-containing membrane protein